MREALFYEKLENNKVKCNLCPRRCVIPNNKFGACGVRKNINGKLYSIVYGKPCSIAIDPIEKKPLFHFLPGSKAFSIATIGCNLYCKYCQNWEISHPEKKQELLLILEKQSVLEPEIIVEKAIANGCEVIAYTYTEPTIFYEYALDIARIAKKQGLKNIIVSNGFIEEQALKHWVKYLHAANIDLKAFNNNFYNKLASAWIEPVLKSLKLYKQNLWLEITNLLIPGWNDDLQEINAMAEWIAKNLGKETPLHITRFYPHYKMLDVPPTPIETLKKARQTALQHLTFVYNGNIPGEENTYCPKCGKLLVRRTFYNTETFFEKPGVCSCGYKLPGVWS
ncbi:AmmeMemoRadiSam system radical SAM enzyme [Candidatus Woesearchaeota archaeon]|nr:AmmeMemoRadiSam system radical SAM enzyme [Candidatus Woesearchaeota archaeon]